MSLSAAVIVARAIVAGQGRARTLARAASVGRRRTREATKMSLTFIPSTFMYVREVSAVPPPGVRATHGVQAS